MKKILKLDRDTLEKLIKEEMDLGNASKEFAVLNFPHTPNAFKVGDTIYMRVQRTMKRDTENEPPSPENPLNKTNVQWCTLSGKITDIQNGVMTVEGIKKPVPTTDPKVVSNSTWEKAFEVFTNGRMSAHIEPHKVKFDYENIDGTDYVVLYVKYNDMSQPAKFGYEYDCIKNGGECKRVNLTTNTDMDNTLFYLRPNEVIPIKSKNPIQDATPLKMEWLNLVNTGGNTVFGYKFNAFNYQYRRELLEACPWLGEKDAVWNINGQKRKGKPKLKK